MKAGELVAHWQVNWRNIAITLIDPQEMHEDFTACPPLVFRILMWVRCLNRHTMSNANVPDRAVTQ
jgi:hypothetical protein